MIVIILLIIGLTLFTIGGAVGVYFLTKKDEEESPTPAPSVLAPTPAPSVLAPTPAPSVLAPTPAPSVLAPTPVPSVLAPAPSAVNCAYNILYDGDCSEKCGGGFKAGRYNITTHPAYGGTECPSGTIEPQPCNSNACLTCGELYKGIANKGFEINGSLVTRNDVTENLGVEMSNAIFNFYYSMEEPICACISTAIDDAKISNINELYNDGKRIDGDLTHNFNMSSQDQNQNERCLQKAAYDHVNNWSNIDGLVNASLNLLNNETLIRKNYDNLMNSKYMGGGAQNIFKFAHAIYFGKIANKIGKCVYSKLKQDYATPQSLINYLENIDQRLISNESATRDELYAMIKRYIRQCISNQSFCSQTGLAEIDEIVRYYFNYAKDLEEQKRIIPQEELNQANEMLEKAIKSYHDICAGDFTDMDNLYYSNMI